MYHVEKTNVVKKTEDLHTLPYPLLHALSHIMGTEPELLFPLNGHCHFILYADSEAL